MNKIIIIFNLYICNHILIRKKEEKYIDLYLLWIKKKKIKIYKNYLQHDEVGVIPDKQDWLNSERWVNVTPCNHKQKEKWTQPCQ